MWFFATFVRPFLERVAETLTDAGYGDRPLVAAIREVTETDEQDVTEAVAAPAQEEVVAAPAPAEAPMAAVDAAVVAEEPAAPVDSVVLPEPELEFVPEVRGGGFGEPLAPLPEIEPVAPVEVAEPVVEVALELSEVNTLAPEILDGSISGPLFFIA